MRQSIRDILATPLGTRVMRRDYGSRLFELVDAPLNRRTILEIIAATAEAIARWEPRFELTKVNVDSLTSDGHVQLTVTGNYLPDGQRITFDGIIA